MKKRICLLMVFTMLLCSCFCLSSCNKDDGDGSGEVGSTTVSTTLPGGEGGNNAVDLYADLPTGQYEGYTFKFLNNISNFAITTIVPTDTRDSISLAMFNRNGYVKSILDIDIQEDRLEYDVLFDTYESLSMTGTYSYDAVCNELYHQTPLSQLGAYLAIDAYDEYLDLEKPWWFTDAMESLQIDGIGFELFGDFHLMYYDCIWGMTFNQDIFRDNGQPFPYEDVKAETWTIDDVKRYVANTTSQTGWENYGVVAYHHAPQALMAASDFKLIEQDEENILKRFDDSDRFSEVYDKIRSAFYTSNGDGKTNWMLADFSSDSYIYNNFAEGRAEGDHTKLFINKKASMMIGTIGDIRNIRASEFDYGIIPMPKFDEDQEQYISYIYQGASSCGIPSSTSDIERTCTILENLSAYSHKLVKSEYYDIVVQGRTVRDNESIEMLDIIFGHTEFGRTTFELDAVYDIGVSPVIKIGMSDNITSVFSNIDKEAPNINRNISGVISAYKG